MKENLNIYEDMKKTTEEEIETLKKLGISEDDYLKSLEKFKDSIEETIERTKELTAEQEDFMIESQLEMLRDKQAEYERGEDDLEEYRGFK